MSLNITTRVLVSLYFFLFFFCFFLFQGGGGGPCVSARVGMCPLCRLRGLFHGFCVNISHQILESISAQDSVWICRRCHTHFLLDGHHISSALQLSYEYSDNLFFLPFAPRVSTLLYIAVGNITELIGFTDGYVFIINYLFIIYLFIFLLILFVVSFLFTCSRRRVRLDAGIFPY
jgi:hypothetical protein